MNDREAFEAWASSIGSIEILPPTSEFSGDYKSIVTQVRWGAWQSATAATQERCAKAVKELDRQKWFPSQRDFAEACVDAIRRMAE